MKLNNYKIITLFLFLIIGIQTSFAITTEIIKTSPSPVVAGDYADITLRFTNPTGANTEKQNVYFQIDNTDFITPISQREEIKKMLSGESITRTFRVYFSEDLNQGEINMPITIGYDDTQTKAEVKIFIDDSQRMPEIVIGQIQTTPNELLEDSDNNKIKIKLQNLGDKSAELLKAELIPLTNEVQPSYSYSFEDSISSIGGGEEKEVEFTLDINQGVEQQIPAQLKLRYRAQKSVGDTYETFEKTINLTLPIMPAPYLVVEKVEQLTDFSIGTVENKLKVTIKNEGKEDAKEVRVRAVPDISYPFTFEETTQYVTAKIKSGESADVIFTLEVTADGEVREYNSVVIIETLVEESRYSREDTISITTTPGKKKDNSFYGYLIVIAVIIISVVIGINTFASRKKSKK